MQLINVKKCCVRPSGPNAFQANDICARLKQLEAENARLKKPVAEPDLETAKKTDYRFGPSR
jgi:hypothetical protein